MVSPGRSTPTRTRRRGADTLRGHARRRAETGEPVRRFMRSVAVLVIVAASSMPSTPVGAAAPAARSTGPACTFDGGFEDGFADVTTDNRHEAAVDCIVYWQVTAGLRPGV